VILACACHPRCRRERRRSSDRAARGSPLCSSGSAGNGVRTVIVEDRPPPAGQRRALPGNFDLALGILTWPAFCRSFNAGPSSKLSESVLVFHGFPVTLNQRVQGSSPCAPTNDFNDLEWILDFCLMVRAAIMACGPLADAAAIESCGVGKTCRNDIAVGAQPLDQEVPHPRLASSSRNVLTARTVARRLAMTAKSQINRRVLRLDGSDGFFRFLSLRGDATALPTAIVAGLR